MAINLVPQNVLSPEEEQAKMMQAMSSNRRNAGLPVPEYRSTPSVADQLTGMVKDKVLSDTVNKGSEKLYEKGGEMFNNLMSDPLAKVNPSAPVGGPLATPTVPTAPTVMPGSLEASVLTPTAPVDAVSAMSQTGTLAAPAGGPLASAVQLPGTVGANAMAQGAGMEALVGGGAELAAGKMAEQAALGGITGGALPAATAAGTGAATAGAATAGAGLGASLAPLMASPLAPLAIGALAGKALGFFEEGGPVGGEFDTREGRDLYDTEEEYQKAVEANKIHGRGIHPIVQPGYFNQGGMMGLAPLAIQQMQEKGIKSGGLLGLAMPLI